MIKLLSLRYGVDDLTELKTLHDAICMASYLVDYNEGMPIAIYDEKKNKIYLMEHGFITKSKAIKKAKKYFSIETDVEVEYYKNIYDN